MRQDFCLDVDILIEAQLAFALGLVKEFSMNKPFIHSKYVSEKQNSKSTKEGEKTTSVAKWKETVHNWEEAPPPDA